MIEAIQIKLFEKWSGRPADHILPLPASGSDRQYYRIRSRDLSAIGTYNPNPRENVAFLTFTQHFRRCGLPVPEIYLEDAEHNSYLQQDLGDTTLFSYLSQLRGGAGFPPELIAVYRRVVEILPQFQITANRELNYDVCYPRPRFDKQSMMWDLNYFKYYFLKLARIAFDEQELEEDFQTLTDYLMEAGCDYFLYRDFQSRNVMLPDGKPHFIDYQGGRKGALQYDLASLLYDAKADLPQAVRDELLGHYLDSLAGFIPVDPLSFNQYFYGYVLIRIMQAMGSYGFRGFYEKKTHFLQSIPYAVENLRYLLGVIRLPVKIPVLLKVLNAITHSQTLLAYGHPQHHLTVHINSFSYRRGVPVDVSGHGGGFVFDCRGIQNPGKLDEFQNLSGRDSAVIAYLDQLSEMQTFMSHVRALVDQSVDKYLHRKFNHLTVSFGCTGGQHRSVYCAEKLAAHLRAKYELNIIVHHAELGSR